MMDIFTKNRFTIWTIVVLVILNLFALATILFDRLGKPPPPPPLRHEGRPEKRDVLSFLKRELSLDAEQIQKFAELREHHFSESRAVADEIHRMKREMMDELFKSSPDAVRVEKLAVRIGEKEAEKEKLIFFHFLDLKSACRPEQRERFQALLHEILPKPRTPDDRHPPPRQDRPSVQSGEDKPPPPPTGDKRPPPP